jgi:small subunit ribosomal protein S16
MSIMVTIRLARAGAKKRPFYHVVATEKSSPRDGRFIERLGYYNPLARGQEPKLVLNDERVQHWRGNGAQVSERVAFLIKSAAKAAA